MESQNARIGMRVKVAQHYRKPELRGMTGMVLQRYGDAEYPALDVLMDGGGSRLFWHHELDAADEEVQRKTLRKALRPRAALRLRR